jgi:hypothetical protein
MAFEITYNKKRIKYINIGRDNAIIVKKRRKRVLSGMGRMA